MEWAGSVPWFIWVFAAIGLYAAVIGWLKLVYAFGSKMANPHLGSPQSAPGSEAFIEAMAYAVAAPTGRGGTVKLLQNGDEFYPALFDRIRAARHSVHIMTYIWREGQVADQLFDLLLDCLRRGVEVRVMMDGVANFIGAPKRLKELRAEGGQVGVFSPVVLRELIHVNKRNHRRAFVIDGAVAFTGGITIADQWLGHAQDAHHWRDTMVEVTGSMALTMQAVFVQLWMNVTGEVLAGPRYYPPLEEPARNPHIHHIGVYQAPSTEVQPLLHFFWFTLHSARRSIYITNAYFGPNDPIRTVLMEKARAGLDVRVMVPGHHTDNRLVRWASHHFYARYLEAGVRLFEFQPAMLHAKVMAVDGCWTVIGSANLDSRSVMLNQENVLGIADEVLARSVEEAFERDMHQCREITLEAWKRRPWYQHVLERAAELFRVQY